MTLQLFRESELKNRFNRQKGSKRLLEGFEKPQGVTQIEKVEEPEPVKTAPILLRNSTPKGFLSRKDSNASASTGDAMAPKTADQEVSPQTGTSSVMSRFE
jgi:hypothetical protein